MANNIGGEPGPILIGHLGSGWRAEVGRGGRIRPVDGGRSIGFSVAADDRWHDPDHEVGVRQHRVEGTPVVETRVRIPNGDLVQRIWSTPAAGGVVVCEFLNESPLPVAVVVDHPGVLTGPAPTGVAPAGIDVPADSSVLPVGHHASVRIAVRQQSPLAGRLPDDLPSSEEVVRGWRALVDQAGRFELPAGVAGSGAVEAAIAARCDWLLGDLSDPEDHPVAALIECDHLVRMGGSADELVPIVATAVAAAARHRGVGAAIGMESAARVLVAAGEHRARRDLARISGRLDAGDVIPHGRAGAVAGVERRLARSVTESEAELLPAGMPSDWMLQGIEVFDLPVGDHSVVSFAVRWHGRRPAVIWEVRGGPLVLRAPLLDAKWSTDEASGEYLWSFEADAPDPL